MPSPPGVTLPAVTVPGTGIRDGAVIRVGEGRRTGSVRLGFGDVIWASAVPQPNKATARTVRRRRSIQDSCVHLKFYIPSFNRRRPIARDGRCYFSLFSIGAACTLLPSARLTIGLRITSSPGLMPSRSSTSVPNSRATVTLRNRAVPLPGRRRGRLRRESCGGYAAQPSNRALGSTPHLGWARRSR